MLKRRKVETKKQYKKRLRKKKESLERLCGIGRDDDNVVVNTHVDARLVKSGSPRKSVPLPSLDDEESNDEALEIYEGHACRPRTQTGPQHKREQGVSERNCPPVKTVPSSSSSCYTPTDNTGSYSDGFDESLRSLKDTTSEDPLGDHRSFRTTRAKVVAGATSKQSKMQSIESIEQSAKNNVDDSHTNTATKDAEEGVILPVCCDFPSFLREKPRPGMSKTEERRLWRQALAFSSKLEKRPSLIAIGDDRDVDQIEVLPVTRGFQAVGGNNYAESDGVGMVFAPPRRKKDSRKSPLRTKLPWWKRSVWALSPVSNKDCTVRAGLESEGDDSSAIQPKRNQQQHHQDVFRLRNRLDLEYAENAISPTSTKPTQTIMKRDIHRTASDVKSPLNSPSHRRVNSDSKADEQRKDDGAMKVPSFSDLDESLDCRVEKRRRKVDDTGVVEKHTSDEACVLPTFSDLDESLDCRVERRKLRVDVKGLMEERASEPSCSEPTFSDLDESLDHRVQRVNRMVIENDPQDHASRYRIVQNSPRPNIDISPNRRIAQVQAPEIAPAELTTESLKFPPTSLVSPRFQVYQATTQCGGLQADEEVSVSAMSLAIEIPQLQHACHPSRHKLPVMGPRKDDIPLLVETVESQSDIASQSDLSAVVRQYEKTLPKLANDFGDSQTSTRPVRALHGISTAITTHKGKNRVDVNNLEALSDNDELEIRSARQHNKQIQIPRDTMSPNMLRGRPPYCLAPKDSTSAGFDQHKDTQAIRRQCPNGPLSPIRLYEESPIPTDTNNEMDQSKENRMVFVSCPLSPQQSLLLNRLEHQSYSPKRTPRRSLSPIRLYGDPPTLRNNDGQPILSPRVAPDNEFFSSSAERRDEQDIREDIKLAGNNLDTLLACLSPKNGQANGRDLPERSGVLLFRPTINIYNGESPHEPDLFPSVKKAVCFSGTTSQKEKKESANFKAQISKNINAVVQRENVENVEDKSAQQLPDFIWATPEVAVEIGDENSSIDDELRQLAASEKLLRKELAMVQQRSAQRQWQVGCSIRGNGALIQQQQTDPNLRFYPVSPGSIMGEPSRFHDVNYNQYEEMQIQDSLHVDSLPQNSKVDFIDLSGVDDTRPSEQTEGLRCFLPLAQAFQSAGDSHGGTEYIVRSPGPGNEEIEVIFVRDDISCPTPSLWPHETQNQNHASQVLFAVNSNHDNSEILEVLSMGEMENSAKQFCASNAHSYPSSPRLWSPDDELLVGNTTLACHLPRGIGSSAKYGADQPYQNMMFQKNEQESRKFYSPRIMSGGDEEKKSIGHNGDVLIDRELSWRAVEQLYSLSLHDCSSFGEHAIKETESSESERNQQSAISDRIFKSRCYSPMGNDHTCDERKNYAHREGPTMLHQKSPYTESRETNAFESNEDMNVSDSSSRRVPPLIVKSYNINESIATEKHLRSLNDASNDSSDILRTLDVDSVHKSLHSTLLGHGNMTCTSDILMNLDVDSAHRSLYSSLMRIENGQACPEKSCTPDTPEERQRLYSMATQRLKQDSNAQSIAKVGGKKADMFDDILSRARPLDGKSKGNSTNALVISRESAEERQRRLVNLAAEMFRDEKSCDGSVTQVEESHNIETNPVLGKSMRHASARRLDMLNKMKIKTSVNESKQGKVSDDKDEYGHTKPTRKLSGARQRASKSLRKGRASCSTKHDSTQRTNEQPAVPEPVSVSTNKLSTPRLTPGQPQKDRKRSIPASSIRSVSASVTTRSTPLVQSLPKAARTRSAAAARPGSLLWQATAASDGL